jgi:hypothetical protein
MICTSGHSGEQIKRDEMDMWHVWVETKATYRCFMGKSEGKRPLGRHRNVWEGIIQMDLQEIGWRGLEWIDRNTKQALVSTVMNLRVP